MRTWWQVWSLWSDGLLNRGELAQQMSRSRWRRQDVLESVDLMRKAGVWVSVWHDLMGMDESASMDPETWSTIRHARTLHDPRLGPEGRVLLVAPHEGDMVAVLVSKQRKEEGAHGWGLFRPSGPDYALHKLLYQPTLHSMVFHRVEYDDRLRIASYMDYPRAYQITFEDDLAPDQMGAWALSGLPEGVRPTLRRLWSGLFTTERYPPPPPRTVYDHLID